MDSVADIICIGRRGGVSASYQIGRVGSDGPESDAVRRCFVSKYGVRLLSIRV